MRVQTVRWRIARRHLNQRRPHRLRWVFALLVVSLLLLSGATAAGAMYFATHLPSADRFHIRYEFQDARIYDVSGHLLYNMADLSRQGGRRMVEPLQDQNDYANPCRNGVNRIPRVLQNATIATEDATFYKNMGFDPWSIVRAAYQDLQYGHIVSGASTITQQVVRNTMLNDQRTLSRKAQEVALAYEITKRFNKRTILWYYLNSVPYGNTAIGAQAAAQVYFHERVCRLDLAQAALLAGLPRAPSLYDPVKYRAAAIVRMQTVLHLMRQHGYLRSRNQVQAAMAEARGWRFSPPRAPVRYPQFVRYVVSQIEHMPGLRGKLYRGIDVYTTLDPRLQNTAQQIVAHQIDGLQNQHVTDGALVSLDLRPKHYGWIMAMVGSAHYRDKAGQINMAITPRQPGSSMKPFNYIWAFTHGGVGPGTLVNDSPIRLPDPNDVQDGGWYEPKNYDHQFHGTVTLRQALANSLNVPAVKVEYYITSPKHVAQTAVNFGMTSIYGDNPGLDCSVCYAVTLGGLRSGTRPLEETAAYGVFATGGWRVPPVAIWKVVRRATHRVLYCSEDCPQGVRPDPALARSRQQVLDGAHAYEMTDVLSDNNARCGLTLCEFGLNSPLRLSRPAAAKTGTTNDWTDNWTVGYTPQLVTGVWVGNADRSPMLNVIGVTGAAPIWHDFMERAFRMLHLPVRWYRAPANVVRTGQCTVPGTSFTRATVLDVYVPSPGRPQYPLCNLPERGYTPTTCLPVPSPTLPQCPPGTPFTTTNPYGVGVQPQQPYNPVPLNPVQPQAPLQPAPIVPRVQQPVQPVQPPVANNPAPDAPPSFIQPAAPAPPTAAPAPAPAPPSAPAPPVAQPPSAPAPPSSPPSSGNAPPTGPAPPSGPAPPAGQPPPSGPAPP